MAIAAWDYAVTNNLVGVPRSVHSNTICMVPSTTPSRQGGNSTNPNPVFPPSTPSRRAQSTPIRGTSSIPSAQGSEIHMAAIVAALNDVDITSHYVVVRGEKLGVYPSRFVSFLSFTLFSNI